MGGRLCYGCEHQTEGGADAPKATPTREHDSHTGDRVIATSPTMTPPNIPAPAVTSPTMMPPDVPVSAVCFLLTLC